MLIVVFILIIVGSFLLFYVSYNISAGVYLKSLCQNPNNNDSIALTFDDGVDPVITPKVLHVLRKYNAKATFFIIGEKALAHPEILQMIVSDGHSVGNHSHSHQWYFPMQSTNTIYLELSACTKVLERTTGMQIKLFRPPFGVTNPMIACSVKQLGLISIGWSIRSFDTLGQPINKVRERVLRQIKPGKVVLLHDNRANAELLLEEILMELTDRKLKIVTIEQLFNLQ